MTDSGAADAPYATLNSGQPATGDAETIQPPPAADPPMGGGGDDHPGAPAPGASTAAPLADITAAINELADLSRRYHSRAEQREGVIDHLRAEVERLRRGERRGLLRPLLTETCRLRNDLLRQAEDLPENFDAEQARRLLRSYAESIEIALEDSGVVSFVPEKGDSFNPRMHRRVGAEPHPDAGLSGCVARVRRNGYLDLETSSPIAIAEVVLYAAAAGAATSAADGAANQPDGPETAPPQTADPSDDSEEKDQP
jgi:molecular chaperone GrpE (heat shock protein)